MSNTINNILIQCRRKISKRRKNNQPYGKEKISDLKQELETIQNDNNRMQDELLEVTRKLCEAYKDEKKYWQQKSRNTGFKEGDNNSKIFHAQTKK